MTRVSRGIQFEYKVRDDAYRRGAKLVVRAAGSHGPVDLAVFFPHASQVQGISLVRSPELIQVKTGTARLSSAKRAELVALAESVGARAVLASPVKNGRRIDVKLEVLA